MIIAAVGVLWLYPDKFPAPIPSYADRFEDRLGIKDASESVRASIRPQISSVSAALRDRLDELNRELDTGLADGGQINEKPDELVDRSTQAIANPPLNIRDSNTSGNRDELVALALDLINTDREKSGVEPVVLGTNAAAQMHAEDMLAGTYISHWTRDGVKPYMIYSSLGGEGYVSENVAISGWSTWAWESHDCDFPMKICQVTDPDSSVRRAQLNMVYDDADSNWGHRDNILNPNHELVNIGIAWNERFVAFVQHFEKISISVIAQPEIVDGVLSLGFELVKPGADIGQQISVYYDPYPVQRQPQALSELGPRSYCYGGGYVARCPEPAIRILAPPEKNHFYTDLDQNTVIATKWVKNGRRYDISARVYRFTKRRGIYTLAIWNQELDAIIFARSLWVN